MKVVIVSDIHGSSFYTKKAIEIFNKEDADLLVLLGDIYNHGPRNPFPQDYAPMEVADLLNAIKDKLIVIKGNCDSEVDQMISEFTFTPFAQIYVDGLKVTLTHGHIFNKDNMPENAGDVLAYGHFHTAFIDKVNNTYVINPGSISLPKDDHRAYIVIQNKTITLKEITGETIKSINI